MNRVKLVAFAASVSLAMAFTFSCSGDDGGGSGNNIVDNGPVRKDKISGVSQKGPFVKGSTATLYELDSKFAQTGRSFRDIIADDKGSFEIKNVELVSPYAMLEADGFYRNEVTGKISTAPIKLYAIADVREKDNINVNLLTHLEYYRVQKLVEGGKPLKEAKKQAQGEILAVFNISGEFANSEDMSIFGTSESDAALLAISVLMQGNLSEGQFVERLTDFSIGFRESGVWSNEATKTAMADWADLADGSRVSGSFGSYCYYGPWDEQRQEGGCWPMPTEDNCRNGQLVSTCSDVNNSLASIKNNILGWELSSSVPDFEKYVRNYWYTNYGLGACNASLQNTIKSNPKGVNYICKGNAWTRAGEYESDTYQWICSTQGEIKDGQVSGTKYICKGNDWEFATEYEIDTYQWVCSTQGEIKDGQVNGTKYICKGNDWEFATEYEIDTYQWVCSTYGEIKSGQASGTKYVCRNEEWQTPPNYIELKCFESKLCLTFKDARDSQSYFYVVIGEQTWMAENLNYNTTNDYESSCSGFTTSPNCLNYNWETAKTACPDGWHLPTKAEWEVLNTSDYIDYYFINNFDEWWTSSEYDSDNAYTLLMKLGYDSPLSEGFPKDKSSSVRCIKD